MRTLGFAAIIVFATAYAVTSFLHGSPWYWIRAASLTLLIVIALGALIVSPGRRAKKDAGGR